jgi:predicted nuclease with TOPRIM domain
MSNLTKLLDETRDEAAKFETVDGRWVQARIARLELEAADLEGKLKRRTEAWLDAEDRFRRQAKLHKEIVSQIDKLHQAALSELRELVTELAATIPPSSTGEDAAVE